MNQYKYIYFLGIGGIGMSALARWFKVQGYYVGGYDKTRSALTEQLIAEGIDVHYDDKVGRIPTAFYKKNETLVVYTPAVPKDNIEVQYFEEHGYEILKRAQVLGLITKSYPTIGVAGTHGKTTTTTMVTQLLRNAAIECTAFMGGISANFGTNMLIGGPMDPLVVEADEYDRSFLTLYPKIAIVTSIDADHLDIYGDHQSVVDSFNDFISQVTSKVIIKKELIESLLPSDKIVSYSIKTEADYYAKNVHIENGMFVFDFIGKNGVNLNKIKLAIPGFHNVENATAALAAALEYGVDPQKLKSGLEAFRGVKRRFEYIVAQGSIIYIDDYAHHPAELAALLSSAKALFANKKVTIAFQPHLYTRTRDFAIDFARSLDLADEVLLLDIYPARELPIAGVTSDMLLKLITNPNKRICTKEELIEMAVRPGNEVFITAGAGDIDRMIEPIKENIIRTNLNQITN